MTAKFFVEGFHPGRIEDAPFDSLQAAVEDAYWAWLEGRRRPYLARIH